MKTQLLNVSSSARRLGGVPLITVLMLVAMMDLQAQFPNFGGDRGSSSSTSRTASTGGLQAATQVTVVADEYSNSLIILAPEAYHAAISNLVYQLDVSVQDITELRVFHLENADPVEMAQVLNSLFPDETDTSSNNSRGPGFFFGGRSSRGGNQEGADSDRSKKQSKVLAVADPRTSSVIVSTSKDLMEQIGPMIASLDASTSKKQKVFVYSVENADVLEVETILRNLFESQNSRNSRNSQTSQQNNALTQRANNAARNQTTGTTGGFGTGGVGGGNSGLTGGR